MEAATPLFASTSVRVLGDRLLVDGLVIDDDTLVRLAREAEDPGRLVRDAAEIGARVLDREGTAAELDFVRDELEKVETAFVEQARRVYEGLDGKLEAVLGPENGHLSRELRRHFSDESATAVQHRMRAVLQETTTQLRDDLRRQFAADDPSNPLAGFQRQLIAVMRQAFEQQSSQQQATERRLAELQAELSRERAEKAAAVELDAERERGTAKGRSFEEAVVEALEEIAASRGDLCDAVGDVRGAGGKKGDVVVSIDACAGPPRGRVVFEAKDSGLSRKRALSDLDAALEQRDADYAVFVVPAEDELPAKTRPLHEYNGDKMFVTYDPEDGSRLALEVAYGLARARVLMARNEASGLDVAGLRAEVERASMAMEDVRRIKSQLTSATGAIETSRTILEAMAAGVRGHLAQLDALLAAPEADD